MVQNRSRERYPRHIDPPVRAMRGARGARRGRGRPRRLPRRDRGEASRAIEFGSIDGRKTHPRAPAEN
jgi:hypothetical protein